MKKFLLGLFSRLGIFRYSVLFVGMLVFVFIVSCSSKILSLTSSNYGSANSYAHILVDQFGYRINDAKFAVISYPEIHAEESKNNLPNDLPGHYQVVNSENSAVVFEENAQIWNHGDIHEQSGDRATWFDFSELRQPGRYFIKDSKTGQRSSEFTISDDVYRDALVAATRMFFYQRSAFEKQPPFADSRWVDSPAFVGPNQDTEARFIEDKDNISLRRDMHGGWFDAGDTNKYVTFAASSIHNLLDAYSQNKHVWTDDFNIPESGNGIPDLLDELMFELDWLKRMQDEDGGVFIKLGNLDFNYAERPGLDPRPRFYGPKCSSSTISLASMFSHASWVFKDVPILAEESKVLEKDAISAWSWFLSHPLGSACDSQEIKSGDADLSAQEQLGLAVNAAVYLFALTSEQVFENYIAENLQRTRPFTQSDWAIYEPHVGSALLAYSQFDNAKPAIRDLVEQVFASSVKPLVHEQRSLETLDPYRAYMPDPQYHWGSNAVKCNIASLIYDAENYRAPKDSSPRDNLAIDFIHYLHGVNPLGIVYLTNMYDFGVSSSANEMYHEWFGKGIYDNALSSPSGPAPGYLTGGPNASYTGSANLNKLPPMKAYLDSNSGGDMKMWEITEPSIVYQSAYIKILSKYV